MLYSSSTNGFYDPEVNTKIPEDAVEISFEVWQSLLEAQSQGKVISSDAKGKPIASDRKPPTKEELLIQFQKAAQKNLDAVAQSWGYDSLLAATSYANSSNAQYQAEAQALIVWRDNYWPTVYAIEENTLPTTVEAFVTMLPEAPAKPVVSTNTTK